MVAKALIAKTFTVAFEGAEARTIEVQCALAAGMPAFGIVGLPDKAVSEARERVRAALTAISIALPMKRITINLSPADLPKEGSHFDLPIALAILAAIGAVPLERAEETVSLGELALDGRIVPVAGALPAALNAAETGRQLICPEACGAGASWIAEAATVAPATLLAAVRHLTGQSPLPLAEPGLVPGRSGGPDLSDVRGQLRAKRALEIAAAGGHHLLLVGPPGAGKSMLAARLPGLLPEADTAEALETSMIHSIAGLLGPEGITRARPFRDPHHNASVAAMSGGGRNGAPGEISLAHNGVLFLDELPEFQRPVLDALRQPIETGTVSIARVHAHVRYPCRFLLVAAANPCRCGHLGDAARACARAPDCGSQYLGRISGPLFDRFDLRIEVPAVDWRDLRGEERGESSAKVAQRVAAARRIQQERFAGRAALRTNGSASGRILEEIAPLDSEGQHLLDRVAEHFGLSARGYHRILRTARTIADLEGTENISPPHLAEAVSYRLPFGPAS